MAALEPFSPVAVAIHRPIFTSRKAVIVEQ